MITSVIEDALSDVARDRIGGVIVITDATKEGKSNEEVKQIALEFKSEMISPTLKRIWRSGTSRRAPTTH